MGPPPIDRDGRLLFVGSHLSERSKIFLPTVRPTVFSSTGESDTDVL